MNRLRNAVITAATVTLLGANLMLLSTRNSRAGGGPPSPIPVTVSNTPVSIVSTDNGALQPVAFTLHPNSTGIDFAYSSFVVPAGKRLVIEFVTARNLYIPVGGQATVNLTTTTSGVQNNYELLPYTNSYQPIFQPVKLYADAGSSVTAFANTFSNPIDFQCDGYLQVSGYYVNVP